MVKRSSLLKGYSNNFSLFCLLATLNWEIRSLYHLWISFDVTEILSVTALISIYSGLHQNFFILFWIPLTFVFLWICIFFQTVPVTVEVIIQGLSLQEADGKHKVFVLLLDESLRILDEILAKMDSGCLCKIWIWFCFNVQNSDVLPKENFIWSFHVDSVFCETYQLIIYSLQFPKVLQPHECICKFC